MMKDSKKKPAHNPLLGIDVDPRVERNVAKYPTKLRQKEK